MGRPETIEGTAEKVTAYGGTGIWVQVDHTVPEQVKALFEQVSREQGGRLDVLVNDIWGRDPLTEWNKSFWNHSLEDGLLMQQRAVHSHIITSYYGVPLMVARRQGLVVEITDGDSYDLRGNLYYDLAKMSAIRLAQSMARELRRYKVAAVALTPGYLRSEAMLDHFGVTEANWRDATRIDPFFAALRDALLHRSRGRSAGRRSGHPRKDRAAPARGEPGPRVWLYGRGWQTATCP